MNETDYKEAVGNFYEDLYAFGYQIGNAGTISWSRGNRTYMIASNRRCFAGLDEALLVYEPRNGTPKEVK